MSKITRSSFNTLQEPLITPIYQKWGGRLVTWLFSKKPQGSGWSDLSRYSNTHSEAALKQTAQTIVSIAQKSLAQKQKPTSPSTPLTPSSSSLLDNEIRIVVAHHLPAVGVKEDVYQRLLGYIMSHRNHPAHMSVELSDAPSPSTSSRKHKEKHISFATSVAQADHDTDERSSETSVAPKTLSIRSQMHQAIRSAERLIFHRKDMLSSLRVTPKQACSLYKALENLEDAKDVVEKDLQKLEKELKTMSHNEATDLQKSQADRQNNLNKLNACKGKFTTERALQRHSLMQRIRHANKAILGGETLLEKTSLSAPQQLSLKGAIDNLKNATCAVHKDLLQLDKTRQENLNTLDSCMQQLTKAQQLCEEVVDQELRPLKKKTEDQTLESLISVS